MSNIWTEAETDIVLEVMAKQRSGLLPIDAGNTSALARAVKHTLWHRLHSERTNQAARRKIQKLVNTYVLGY